MPYIKDGPFVATVMEGTEEVCTRVDELMAKLKKHEKERRAKDIQLQDSLSKITLLNDQLA